MGQADVGCVMDGVDHAPKVLHRDPCFLQVVLHKIQIHRSFMFRERGPLYAVVSDTHALRTPCIAVVFVQVDVCVVSESIHRVGCAVQVIMTQHRFRVYLQDNRILGFRVRRLEGRLVAHPEARQAHER